MRLLMVVRTVCPYCHKEQRDTRIAVEISADQTCASMLMTIHQCRECYKKYVAEIPATFESREIEGEKDKI